MKKLLVFDLDGTLAKSKSPIDGEMASLIRDLLGFVKVAVISGGDWTQFAEQVSSKLPQGEFLKSLYLLPTSGTKFYEYKGTWEKIYSEDINEQDRSKIIGALKQAVATLGYTPPKTWGEVIEDRGSQITYSALGQSAPIDEKQKWDPDFAKRKKIQKILSTLIPDFSVNLGGTSSVDVTRHGVDKAYGIGKLCEILKVSTQDILFVGDALFPGGNDYPAKKAGVYTIAVRDPEETKRVIQAIITCK